MSEERNPLDIIEEIALDISNNWGVYTKVDEHTFEAVGDRIQDNIQALRARIAELEKELRGVEGKLVLAEVVIEKYKRGELLPEPPAQCSSFSDSDTPPAEAEKAVSGEPSADSPEES